MAMTTKALRCIVDNDNDGNFSYEAAVSALLSPIHQATTPQALREAAIRRTNTLQDMQTYMRRLGLNLNGTDAQINDDNNKNNNYSSKEGIATAASTTHAKDTDNDYHIPSLILHVTGTKGKGSTLSLCESILRNAYGLNTGLFTSPHLVNICERIRINGAPISNRMFGRVYWSVRHKLEKNHDHIGVEGEENASSLPPLPILPGYFRMLTLMALYTFCHHQTRPKIDVILLEVGMGGRYDATNVFEPMAQSSTSSSSSSSFITNHEYDHDPTTSLEPSQNKNNERRILVRGVTLIDYDHTRILGSTLSQIAWEKGGIYVRNKLQCIGMNDGGYDRFVAEKCNTIITADAASFSNNGEGQVENNLLSLPPQPLTMQPTVFVSENNNSSEVLPVLDRIAKCNGSQLQVVREASIESIPQIGLQGDHQRSNAALALAMCRYAMNHRQKSCNPSMISIRDALSKTFWPGRCHTVQYPIPQHLKFTMNLRCDGAHTPLSMRACIEWFRRVVVVVNSSSSSSSSIVETSTTRKFLIFNCGHDRNPIPLIYSLYTSNAGFESIYFCHADFERPSAAPKRLEKEWKMERLVSQLDDVCGESNIDMTFQSMCHNLQTIANVAAATGHSPSMAVQDDGITNLLSKLSTSTTSSWQETLANVWKVIDTYSREFNSGTADGDGSENALSKCCMRIVTGLNVNYALTSIQEEVTSTMKIEDSKDADGSKNMLVVEVCVTGSLYIVGSALAAAGWEERNMAE